MRYKVLVMAFSVFSRTHNTMAEIDDGNDVPPPNKKVKQQPAPCEVVIPKLQKEKIALLHDALMALENDIHFSFNLLKIINSNAEMCVPFTHCFLKVERSVDLEPEEATSVYNFTGVFRKGINILKLYLEDPEEVPEDKETRIALKRLAETILKIEDIGQSLVKKMMPNKKRETAWPIRLVHHLLKELSVNQQYTVDSNSELILDFCTCCKESIEEYGCYKDCSIGNSEVWHGCVDILLGQHLDVAVYAKDSDDAASGTDVGGSLSSFEVKDSTNLLTDRAQIIAETIVFAFLQKKNNPARENYLIPTIAISKEHVLFHFYDPEHDILLESPPYIIFLRSKLFYPTVLALWFTLNYKTFCTGITRGMKESNFTADFLSRVDDGIKSIYKKYLQFGDCGIGSVKSNYYTPTAHAGWRFDKSEPYKSSILKWS